MTSSPGLSRALSTTFMAPPAPQDMMMSSPVSGTP